MSTTRRRFRKARSRRHPLLDSHPHFHGITIENLTAKDSVWAGVIIGLPEAPVTGIILRNVSVEAVRGLTIAYAKVHAEGLHVTASAGGQPITTTSTATLTGQ